MAGLSFDAILFDFDGVLVDSEPVHFAAWNAVLARFGVRMDWDKDYQQFIGRSDREMLRHFGGLADPPISFEQIWELYPAKCVEFRQRMLADFPCAAETVHLLGELASYPKAIVTSSSRSEVLPLLESAGLGHHFSTVIGSEDTILHKPDPAPYREAAQRLGAARPLVVEDSDAGETAGRAAGFEVVRVPEYCLMPELVRRRLGDNRGVVWPL
jgi:beta-phosphoglucomutase